jgi:putative membrane protein
MKLGNRFAGHLALAAAITILPVAALAQNSMEGQSSQGSMGSQNSMSPANSATGHLSMSDKKFVSAAAEGGLAEVDLGKLAEEKASSPQVKQFAERMVTDHSKANDQLKQVASEDGIQLPDKLSAESEMTKNQLSQLSGAQFDAAYMRDMVKDHKKDVAAFQRESNSGTNSAVKEFASQTLPTLQSHLQEAEQVAPTTSSQASR